MSIGNYSPALHIDLSAIVRNYNKLRGALNGKQCGAVVKANAYGLGVDKIAPALYSAGCRNFFVATLEEGIELRSLWAGKPEPKPEPKIYVFHGLRKGQASAFATHHLIPVLNDLGQVQDWDDSGPWVLHIDTGMRRLGLTPKDAEKVTKIHNLSLVMSHLACGNEPGNPMNRQQLDIFKAVLAHFPNVPVSLANSSGIYLGPDYHFDLARPGCSLYGIIPNCKLPNPVENVITLSAPVLQYREIDSSQSVGYGATASVPAGTVLATVELGYADGFPRVLSNNIQGFVDNISVPLIGRVSMDMVSIDVTHVPAHLRTADMRVTFIGKQQTLDTIAKAAGTIGYEILTRLGTRVKRIYI